MWWLAALGVASAADWTTLQGTETGEDPPMVKPWGFVQVLGEGIVAGGPVEGLSSATLSAFDGEVPVYNRVGSGDATFGLSIRRARVGLRGAMPKTDERVNYLFAAEFGDNGLTRLQPVVLTDASITLSYVPYARVRVGQFKMPLGEEALEMNPIAAEFVNFTNTTSQLLLENPSAGGVYVAGASGFRDVGVQVFDTVALGSGALSYAAVVSNGRMGTLDVDDGKDVMGRLAWAPVVWGEPDDPHREEIQVFAFWQQGTRDVDGDRADRIRRGGGIQVQRSGIHARAEVIQATGTLETGTSPPFPGQPVTVAPEGQAVGGYAFVKARRGVFGAGLRYDELWRRTESPADLRVFRTGTLDLQVEPTPRVRALLDVEARFLAAPEGSDDAKLLADAMGHRISLMTEVIF